MICCVDFIRDNIPHGDTFVYTYTDKEFHCFTNMNQSNAINKSHLIEGISSLPAHNLHSTETLSKDATTVHDRISREDPFEIMYIVAAVDCEGDE